MAIDYATDAGKVRLLISDVDEAKLVFTDAEIAAFLALEAGVKRAAAAALETIATNEALVLKVIRTQDLQTDGAKLSAELRARAADLRVQGALEADLAVDGGFFVVDTLAYAPGEPWVPYGGFYL